MNQLINKINKDLKIAMKEKDIIKKLLCQMLKSKFAADKKEYERKYLGIFDDTRAIPIIQKELKECDEEIEAAVKANRQDLLSNLSYKKELLEQYLPKQLSVEELKSIVKGYLFANNLDLVNEIRKNVTEHISHIYFGQTTGKEINKSITQLMRS